MILWLALSIIGAILGRRRWGGWHGAIKGVLVVALIYFVVASIMVAVLFLGGSQVERLVQP